MAKYPGWVKQILSSAKAKGADTNTVLGCGHFGCVFPYAKNNNWVIKVTIDPTEAPMWKWIHEHQKAGDYGMDAFAFTKGVWGGGTVSWRGKRVKVTIVQRETVDPSTNLKRANEFATRDSAFKVDPSIRRSIKGLFAAQVAARRFHTLKRQEMKDMALQQYMSATDEVQSGMPYIGDAMAAITGEGIVLADVHSDNVGRSIVDWGEEVRPPGTWIIFDPGHTPILDADEVWQ